MDTTMEEGNNAFAELITRACGPRSLSEYGRACGISPAHLSRIKSGICRPSKKMCLKMASEHYAKEIGLSSEDFLRAAGYDDGVIENAVEFDFVVEQQQETIALGVISKYLMYMGVTYQLLPMGDSRGRDFAFLVSKDNNTKVRWEFVLNFSYDVGTNARRMEAYYYNLGRIFSFQNKKDSQYTMVLNDDEMYERLMGGVDPNIVSADVTIALIDFEIMQIKKETSLGRGGSKFKLLPL